MKRVLFKRILILYLIVTPLLILFLELYLSNIIKNNYIAELRDNLILQARLIADEIPPEAEPLDHVCRRFKEKIGARITIIDKKGRVLGDSDQLSASMENHADRSEIRDAAISGTGNAIRFSKTIRRNLFYLAIVFDQDENEKFLRLSIPLQDIETAVNDIRLKIFIGSFSALLIIILIGLIQTRKITKSIEEITSFSKEVSAGNFTTRLFLKEKGELGELGKNISNMSHVIHERLRQSEDEKQKIEAILKNMSDGLILTDKKGTILLLNDAVKSLFKVETSIEGKSLMEGLRNAELMDLLESVVETEGKISRETEISFPKEAHLTVAASPFYTYSPEKEMSGVVLTFHDITRLKKLEEIRKDFVANVSHEIKTPITAIQGFAETLLDGALDDRDNARRFLKTIKYQSERLNSLVTDLLTLSRIELGDITIKKKPVDLEEVFEIVYATLREKAESKDLSLEKQIDAPTKKIMADKDRLIQILLNLVDNGIKFTDKGGVTLHTAEERYSEPNGAEKRLNVISVEDTGVGIPHRHLARLGERFYRVDRARSRELGGTGLGLAIVKHLVRAHGWEIEFKSTEATGTTVRIILPVSE